MGDVWLGGGCCISFYVVGGGGDNCCVKGGVGLRDITTASVFAIIKSGDNVV